MSLLTADEVAARLRRPGPWGNRWTDVDLSEICIDMFAGAGGASCGIEAAGIRVHVAINHDPDAVALHRRNHPYTEHHTQDIYTLSPLWVTRGRPVGLLWMSPDCTHHSKAKGGAPTRDVRRRELAMVLVDRWIPELGENAPRVVILENVEEFADWGPLDRQGQIVDSAKGERFKTFVRKLRAFGYRVDWRELRACDYGTPTIRKRLFMIARRDSAPIVWPKPTHGAPDSPEVFSGTRKPWRTAAECIDWGLPCPSIFSTSAEIMAQYGIRAVRPLAENTLRRIAKGVVRYVLENPKPFLVNLNHTASYYRYFRGQELEKPMPTVTTSPEIGLVAPFLAKHYGGVVGQSVNAPSGTVTTIDHHSLCAVYMTKIQADSIGDRADAPLHTVVSAGMHHGLCAVSMVKMRGQNIGDRADAPLHTVTASGTHHALCAAHMIKFKGDEYACELSEPAPTICTKVQTGIVAAFLAKYYGSEQDGVSLAEPLHTVTTRDRFGVVTVNLSGESYVLCDIGMRMLTPRELARAQGFPDSYVLDEADGRPVTKTGQIHKIGNAVCCQVAQALAGANFTPGVRERKHVHLPLMEVS